MIAATARPPVPKTTVDLLWIDGQIERWLRFGRDAGERIVDRRRRLVSFQPDAVFAFVRWASNDFGTALSRIDILRAVGSGEPYATVPFVEPGGDILLRIHGWSKVQRVFAAIDAVEALDIDPADVAPVTVDGRRVGLARERDRIGRVLPSWSGCRAIVHGELFLMNTAAPDSLDGRYFGPLPANSVLGWATPLWTDHPRLDRAAAGQRQ